MYWTDWSEPSRLERASLDGTQRMVIIQKIGKVHAIALDFVERKMYWASIDREMIESAYMNGKLGKLVVSPVFPRGNT